MSLNFKADPCFLICGLDCFYTGNAKNYGSCPLDKILSSGYLANPCLCFCIALSSILNNRALVSNFDFHITRWCRLVVARPVPLVKQEV
jgi:hypothetical protein